MALLKRNPALWLIRTLGALMVAFAALAGVTGQAFAHDDEHNNEVVTYGPNACTVVADLPVYQPATCVKHKSELDDGVTEIKNSYVAQVAADNVRQAFEATFRQQSWAIVEFKQDAEDQESLMRGPGPSSASKRSKPPLEQRENERATSAERMRPVVVFHITPCDTSRIMSFKARGRATPSRFLKAFLSVEAPPFSPRPDLRRVGLSKPSLKNPLSKSTPGDGFSERGQLAVTPPTNSRDGLPREPAVFSHL